MIDAWISCIIVSLIFSLLFNGAWWATLIRVLVFIHALEVSLRYFASEENRKRFRNKLGYTNVSPTQIVNQPQTQPAIQTVMIQPPIATQTRFCAGCGTKLDLGGKFCPYCGQSL
jgi:hypothetical protein